jgi:antitoxin MazE
MSNVWCHGAGIIMADLSIEEGAIIIRRVAGPGYSLDDLLDQITSENLHGEIDTGEALGNEAW